MPPPTQVSAPILSYAHGTTAAPLRIPLWLVAGLVPAAISIPLDFAWGTSPLTVMISAVSGSVSGAFSFGGYISSLAFGLSLALPTFVLSCLVGRASHAARIAALCVLPLAAIGMISAALVAYSAFREQPFESSFSTFVIITYIAVFLAGVAFLIRNIRRRCPLAHLTLLALTTAHLSLGLFCFLAFYSAANAGYFVTAISYPFYVVLALRLILHRPDNP